METFLHPMFLFSVPLPLVAGMLFCFWMLWDLKQENAKAAAGTAASGTAAAATAVRAMPVPGTPSPSLPSSPSSSSSPRWATPSLAPIAVFPEPATVHMTDVRKLAWDDMAVEELTPLIGRRLIYTERQMLAHVYLKQGAIVPAHDHINEQITYVLSGALRFWIGAQADAPGDTFTDVRAGEVLVIPSMVRHRAEALEDTLDVDIFNPPRQDWIDKSDNYLRTGEPMTGSR
jgi:quercetin dioxygenase-like cupin family protein